MARRPCPKCCQRYAAKREVAEQSADMTGSASPFPSAWVNDGLAEFGERDLLVNNFRRFRTLHRAYVSEQASVLSPLKLAPRVPPHRSTRRWTCGSSTNTVGQRDPG